MSNLNVSRQGQSQALRKRKEREGPAPEPAQLGSNRLLAGYLAHEFLTRRTLFGQKWDLARAGAGPISFAPKPERPSPSPSPSLFDKDPAPTKSEAYADVARFLSSDGAHIPGIVNPTQLHQWLQM